MGRSFRKKLQFWMEQGRFLIDWKFKSSTHLVQFSLYKMLSETVMSQIFSTVLCLASMESCITDCDNVMLLLLTILLLLLYDCIGFIWRFVDANVLCCIWLAPPSMARKINEPGVWEEQILLFSLMWLLRFC